MRISCSNYPDLFLRDLRSFTQVNVHQVRGLSRRFEDFKTENAGEG